MAKVMKIAATGFVSAQAGSVASANALLLRLLVETGHQVDFFSKPSFVDPRPAIGEHEGFRFVPVVNAWQDSLRQLCSRIPIVRFLAERLDAWSYNKLLVRRISEERNDRGYDIALWMGDYAYSSIPGILSVSFAQGPPGTDARAIVSRWREIRQLAGFPATLKWLVLGHLRLSAWGLPPMRSSDHIIVGSSVSCDVLKHVYAKEALCSVSALPYPIDLDLFRADPAKAIEKTGNLKVLWLGRIVPRKRLDLFLDGIAEAIRNGLDIQATIVGRVGFVPGYEKKIAQFPFPDRLTWIHEIPREKVPDLLLKNDVLIQPSDEENFGSSVAEAQACGLPVIVGNTNGNKDYLCERDVHLPDDKPESLMKALQQIIAQKQSEQTDAWMISRKFAAANFDIEDIGGRLAVLLEQSLNDAWREKGK
jgi:glycosyltransferase involved in cell wall biosynthesis